MITIWSMAKRYIAAAVVGVLATGLAAAGIDLAASPELLEQIHLAVDALLMGVFYVATILFKTWRQKKVLQSGEMLPERVESASTAREHGSAVAP
jgi:uncharacterized membrane protein YqjE